MLIDHRAKLKQITSFASLVGYLRDEMGWPIDGDDLDPISFDYTAEELGIEPASAAKILEIKRLRPLSVGQPWGIFFVRFEPKRLPVVVLRRILSRVVLKKRASANSAERTAWEAEDLLFVSNFGEGDDRQICFAHFTLDEQKTGLPTLKVLGWNDLDTPLRLDHVADTLTERLAWPDDERDVEGWRERWRSGFTLRHREAITTSKLLAERLAALARAIRNRINMVLSIETEDGPLTKLMKAFREALVHDLDVDGFADMYAQTIAYGLLSARIADPKAATADDFAAHMRTNPFLKELMETFLHVGGRRKSGNGVGLDFDELGVSEVVALLDAANMEAVLRDFGDRKPEEDPVIHFYELFLKEYDAKKRTQRGVFYTPLPVVSYIVRSVHELLQTEFGLADGLADTATWGDMAERHPGLTLPKGVKAGDRFVTVLDPATGTGTFLVEAIEVIHHTLLERWKREGHREAKILDLWNEYVPKHLLPRLHGYELLMAPYAIAHVKIGLKLHETGYRFGSDERARIYLTNSLEPAQDFSGTFEFAIPALAHEAQAVNAIKRDQRFTIVIGNPPYSLMSANLEESHRRFVEPYKFVDGKRIKERGALQLEKNLQDDYVKFIRLGQTLCDAVPMGALSLVTNHTYLENPTLRGLRNSLLRTFDRAFVLDLHGNAKRHEACPLPEGDENVFEIQQGVAISLFAKHTNHSGPVVWWGELWGSRESKYAGLLRTSAHVASAHLVRASPPLYLFIAQDELLFDEFGAGFAIDEIFGLYSTGIATARDSLTVHLSKEELASVLDQLSRLEPEQARERFLLGPDTNDWKIALAQADLRRTRLARERICRVLYRPFDRRWTYYTGRPRGFHCNPRRPVMQHLLAGSNVALCAAKAVETGHGFSHVFVTSSLADHHCVSLKEVNYILPLFLYPEEEDTSGVKLGFGAAVGGRRSNLSQDFCRALERELGIRVSNHGHGSHAVSAEEAFGFVYSILFAPSYRRRYASFLRKEFARISVPRSPELFREMARLGGKLVALHLMGSPRLDRPMTTYTGPEKPVIGRIGWSDDTVWIDAVKPKRGAADCKVTGTVGFRGVPEDVWNFHIGGYQVCEKWLKDRKGRTLTAEDITHYHRIVIALHETIGTMREIDEVIEAHGGWPGAFQSKADKGSRLSELTEGPPEQRELVSAQPARERSER